MRLPLQPGEGEPLSQPQRHTQESENDKVPAGLPAASALRLSAASQLLPFLRTERVLQHCVSLHGLRPRRVQRGINSDCLQLLLHVKEGRPGSLPAQEDKNHNRDV